jgi:hypothetical protein
MLRILKIKDWLQLKKPKFVSPGVYTIEGYVGYVYAPYVPVVEVEPIPDFEPGKALLERYAKKRINDKFYGVIKIPGTESDGMEKE